MQNKDLGEIQNWESMVFRPIQYLGVKLRTLELIIKYIENASSSHHTIWDIFTGTSVVAQALARTGYNLIASDAMEYSVVFASALLGVERNEDIDISAIFSEIDSVINYNATINLWEPWISEELEAVHQKNPDKLIKISQEIPQYWRPKNAREPIINLFNELSASIGNTGYSIGSIVSAFYGGTYFGISQAIEIDSIRITIQSLYNKGTIGNWEKNVLLTALLSATSDSVFSAGKHFAQAHRIRPGKDLTFIKSRIIQDRGINIRQHFKNKVNEILKYARPSNETHVAFRAKIEDVPTELFGKKKADLIYADPPYTAQQYSRFYHIPETIVNYQIPRLQIHRGKVTRGIYPDNRYKSRFCSKRQAPAAFKDLIFLSKHNKSDLVISYSGSKTGKTGNERMISLAGLLKLCNEYFGSRNITVSELDHDYRQFNQSDLAVDDRGDKEFLIYCECT